jgi:hypothetical protein
MIPNPDRGNGNVGRPTVCSDPAELESHDEAFGSWQFDAVETEVFEHLLATEECVGRVPLRSSQRPAFDGRRTFAAGQFDRCTHERVADALAPVPSPDEDAG